MNVEQLAAFAAGVVMSDRQKVRSWQFANGFRHLPLEVSGFPQACIAPPLFGPRNAKWPRRDVFRVRSYWDESPHADLIPLLDASWGPRSRWVPGPLLEIPQHGAGDHR